MNASDLGGAANLNQLSELTSAIDGLDVHDHLCLIYESLEEQLAAVIPFIRAGLERHERCLYVADDNSVEVVLSALRTGGIDVDGATASGALAVITKREAYLKEGRFDPDWMINFIRQAAEEATAAGFKALRGTGEMTWVLGGEPGVERLIEYEAKLNYLLPEIDCLVICQYNRNRFVPEVILDVIRTHPLVICGARVCQNFYYVPPDSFLAAMGQGVASEVDRMLASLREREEMEERIRERESQLRASMETVRENEAKFSKIFQESPVGIEIYDADGLLIDANQACLDIFGVEDVLEVKGFRLFGDPNLTTEQKQTLRDGQGVHYESAFDFNLVKRQALYRTTKSGKIFIESYIIPISGNGGAPSGYLVHVEDITERKIREETYRSLVENSLQGMVIFQQGRVVYANRAMAELFGYNVEELQALTVRQLLKNVHPDDLDMATDLMQDVLDGVRQSSRQQFRFYIRTGDLAYVETLISRIDYEGRPALQAVYVDRTERVIAEEKLKEAYQLLETIFDNTHLMVAYLDPQFNFIRVNRAYAIADERGPDFYEGKNHFDLFPNEDNQRIFQRVVETGQPHFENAKPFQYAEHPERGVSYWDWSLTPAKDSQGNVVALILVLQDVTDRILAQEAIICSEEKYRTLFEESKDGVIIINADGKILDINAAGVEMLGYGSREEMLALPSVTELYQRPADRQAFLDKLKAQGFVSNYELNLKTRDGDPRLVSVTSTAERDEATGDITSFRGIVRDITTQRQLEHQLIQAQRMESIGRLAGGVAHDFNNYLTAILGYIDLAAMEAPAGSPGAEELAEARVIIDSAANLARQLLLFSRRETADLKAVDINQTIGDMQKMLGRLIGEQYTITVDLEEGANTISADIRMLEQVIMNLAINARDAMPGGGPVTISTRNVTVAPDARQPAGRPDGDYLRLSVKDAGTGMDAETLSHIFEPFYSTKRKEKGTGLGLSVVYGIVSQHDGWIDVESTPGKGTTFSIFLPAVFMAPVKTAASHPGVDELRGNGEKVLLVEDDETIRKLAGRMLSENGYEVLAFPDAERALAAFEAQGGEVDLVFTDVVLPGADGIWLADRLREKKPDLGVLLSTGYSRETDWRKIQVKGYRLLRKPYAIPDLMRAVWEILVKAPGTGQ